MSETLLSSNIAGIDTPFKNDDRSDSMPGRDEVSPEELVNRLRSNTGFRIPDEDEDDDDDLARALGSTPEPKPHSTVPPAIQKQTKDVPDSALGIDDDDADFFADDNDDSSATNDSGSKSSSMSSMTGIFKNKYFILGISLVLIILLVFIIVYGKKGFKKDEAEPDPELVDPIEHALVYNQSEWEQLRACGYSADEIENAQSMGVTVEDMVATAEQEREEWWNSADNIKVVEKEVLLDDTLNAKLANTWYGMPAVTTADNYLDRMSEYVQVERNLDYEKVEIHGHQLFIKVFLNHEKTDFFFASVTPEEYFALPQSGNIICTYTYSNATPAEGQEAGETFITDVQFTLMDN